MSWNKTGFSYLLWGIYSLTVILGFGCIGIYAGSLYGLDMMISAVAAGVIAGGILLIFTGARMLLVKKENAERSGNLWLVWEGLAVVLLLGAGIALRVGFFRWAGEEDAYYEAAKVIAGQGVPQVAHGAVYFYLQLLNSLFLVVGNKWAAGIWMQIVLQLLGTLVLYFALRMLAGKVSALITMGIFMLSPAGIGEALTYSSRMLYFLQFSIGLLWIAFFLKMQCSGKSGRWYDGLLLFLMGSWIALLCYQDVAGVILLLFAASVLWLKKEPVNGKRKSGIPELLIILLGTGVSFCGYLALDAWGSGSVFVRIWNTWCRLFAPETPVLATPFQPQHISVYIGILVVSGFLLSGVFSFWFRKKEEKFSPWILPGVGVIAGTVCQITSDEISGQSLLFWLGAVLAGIAVTEWGYRKEEMVWEQIARMEAAEEDDLVILAESTQPTAESAQPVQFIENPLPLPKKHVKKVMDYDRKTQAENWDYEIDVAEDDDFDIF